MIVSMETSTRNKRKQASELFEEIRGVLLERESAVFKAISDNLNMQTQSHRSQVLALEQQLESIQDLKLETAQALGYSASSESRLQTLANASARAVLISQALHQVEFKAVKSSI